MEKVSILHLITAAKNASPFDVNMAYDAGFDKIMPYTNVALEEVRGLVQDAIFRAARAVLSVKVFLLAGVILMWRWICWKRHEKPWCRHLKFPYSLTHPVPLQRQPGWWPKWNNISAKTLAAI